ncbi:MAG: sigma-54-dependent Fis family transcriptional regulator [Bacteroidetes bacterium]|nr:sigma-54-dependent Fis family transcriptional regulator [Bacteroidota bacterium]
MEHRILLVDDDLDTCKLLTRLLEKNSYVVDSAHSGKSALTKLKEQTFDAVLCDFRLGDMDGIEILSGIKSIAPQLPVIIITGYSDIRTAVNVIQSGAFDYIAKPLIPEEILIQLKKAIAHSKQKSNSENEKKAPPPSTASTGFVMGTSPQSIEIEKQIELVAPTNFSVIIFGETGSGKEAVARKIHEKSKRAGHPFVALDCGALPKDLAGSELFGHEKGAFTGAINSKAGQFELAEGGTLFLDEVANLPFDIQTLLLRVVQERKMKRIGGANEISLDVRILVASNENLYEATKKGKFREDLYHRFNEFSIHLSPLRERKEDILPLANWFLKEVNEELQKQIEGFDEDVSRCLLGYSWPGNIRELKNVVKRATLLAQSNLIQMHNLPLEISNPSRFMGNEHFQDHAPIPKTSPDLKSAAMQAEYEAILEALKKVNFNKSKAAELLKIDRKTLYNKMKMFRLTNETSDGEE